jgi:hypothetical protein
MNQCAHECMHACICTCTYALHMHGKDSVIRLFMLVWMSMMIFSTCDHILYIKILFQVITVIHFPIFLDNNISAVLKYSFKSATKWRCHLLRQCSTCDLWMNEYWSLAEWYKLGNTKVLRENSVPVPLFPLQILQGLSWDWTRTYVFRGWWLTTQAAAQPHCWSNLKNQFNTLGTGHLNC